MSHRSVFPACDPHTETDFERVANLPDESLPQMVDVTPPGVYFGYAQISARRSDGTTSDTLDEGRTKVHPMVMSLGWNPFYKNEKLTAVRHYPAVPASLSPHLLCFGMQEIHIMHPFDSDFYGHEMKAIVLGYIRPELNYTSRGAHPLILPIGRC